jgi:hypothetical protein
LRCLTLPRRRDLSSGISRIPGYALGQRVTFRLGEFELAMLHSLMSAWKCNRSEAMRRCIVYTFSKLVAGVDKFDEESVKRALELALDMSRMKSSSKNNW